LAYISFTQERKLCALIVSGIAAGLAFLTKSPGFILVPTMSVVTLLHLWQKLRQDNLRSWTKLIWREGWPFVVWSLLSVLVFFVTWPAMWVAPLDVLSNVFGMAQTYASSGHNTGVFFNGQILEGGDFGLRYFYFYPLTYLWRATPVSMIGLFVFFLGFIKKVRPLEDSKIRWFAKTMLIAIFIFVIVMAFGQKKFDRYILPVYAPLDILAGLGWYVITLWLKDRLQLSVQIIAIPFVMGIIIFIQAFSSLSVFPDLLAYYNPLMGGSRKAPNVMQIGWGEGLDQAALYLNQKNDADNLVVSSWYGLGSFSFYFDGETIDIPNKELTDSDWQAIHSSDFIVTYVHQWQRNLPAALLSELAAKIPEKSIWINGIEYVRIYKQD
jgi:hypothetical protein